MANHINNRRAAHWSAARIAVLPVLLLGASLQAAAQAQTPAYRIQDDTRRHQPGVVPDLNNTHLNIGIRHLSISPSALGAQHTCKTIRASLVNHKDQFNIFRDNQSIHGNARDTADLSLNTRTYAGATMGGNNLFKVSATAKPGVHSLHNHIDAGVYTVNIEFTGSGNFTGVTCVPYTVTLAAFTLKVQHALTGPTGNRWREGPRGRNQRRASRHKPHPTINSNLDIATAVSIQKSSSRVDTGMTLHQFFLDCPLTRHEFEGPSQMEMAVMYPYDSTQRENSIEVSVRGGGFANNVKAGEKEQHVRVYFRSDARFEAGSKITTTIRSYVDSSCDGNWRGVEEDNGITVPAVSSVPFATYVNSFNLPERQTWSTLTNHSTVAVSLNRYDTRRARQDTGIRIHVGNTACVTTNVWLLTPSSGVDGNPFRLVKNSQSSNTSSNVEESSDAMAMGDNNSDYYWLVTRSTRGTWNEPFYSRPGAIDFSLQIANFDSDCEAERRVFRPSPNRYPMTVQITIHDAWDNWYKRTSAQRTDYTSETPFDAEADPSTPDGGKIFSPVRLATMTGPQEIGVSIKRIQYHCQIANVALLEGENEYFDLNVYDNANEAYVPGQAAFSAVNMTMSEGRHVRLQLKPGTAAQSVTTALTLAATVVVDKDASCTNSLLAGPELLAYTLTIGPAPAWEALDSTGGKNVGTAASVFRGPEITSQEDTGISIHYGMAGGACESFDVAMLNYTDFLELRKHDTSDDSAGASTTSFEGLEMKASTGDYLAVRFNGKPVLPDARATQYITLSLALDVNASCATVHNVPYPTVLAYPLTIRPDTPWEERSNHVATVPSANYYAVTMTTATDTGARLQRSSLDCPRTDVRLLNLRHAFALSLEADDGTAGGYGDSKTDSASNVNMVTGAGGMKVALYIRANPQLAAGPHTLTVEYAANATCAPRDAITETFTVSFGAGDVPWTADSDEVTAPPAAIDTDDLDAGAVNTGLHLQRVPDDCEETTVRLLGHHDILELRKYDGSNAVTGAGNSGSVIEDVDMTTGGDDDHVRLYFKSGHGDTTDTQYVVTVQMSAGDGCDFNGLVAAVESVAVTLSVNDNHNSAPAITHNQDGNAFTLILRDRHESRDTGLVITVVDDKDAEDGWPQMAITGADASAFTLMTIASYSREYSQLVLSLRIADATSVAMASKDEYAIGIRATDHDDSGATASLGGFRITVAQVTVRDPETEEAVRGIGGVAARAIGLGGIDSVLGRAQIGGDARLAQRDGSGAAAFSDLVHANEEAIENGDFDLREMMTGQAFALPLGVGEGVFDSGIGVWGKVDLLDMASGPDSLTQAGDVKQEGEIFSAQFGIDTLLANGWLAGVGYGVHEAESTYQRRNNTANIDGTYKLDINVIQPYVGFDALGGRLAASAGFGSGDLVFTDADINTPAEEEYDAGYRSYALGYGMIVSEPGAADELSVRGAFVSSELDIDGEVLDAENNTLRLALAYVRSLDFGGSQQVKPSLEVAYANSWGASDADDGDGYEVIAGLGYARDRLEAEASYLYISTGGGTESKTSGASLSFRYRPLAAGLGLGLQAQPSYGPTEGSDGALWELDGLRSLSGLLNEERILALRTGIDYGFAVPGGVLTPYGRYDVIGSGAARELGLRMNSGLGTRWILSYRRAADDVNALKIEYWLGE